MSTSVLDWYQLFNDSSFGDLRLNRRAAQIASALECSTEGIVRATMPDAASLKGTYRFINNERITPENLTESSIDKTIGGLSCPHVLFVQDTSEFSYPGLKKNDLGLTGNGDIQGFFLHPGIFIDPEQRHVLGLGAAHFWTRQDYQGGAHSTTRKTKPIEEKESYRWLQLPKDTCKQVADEVKITVVGDRESDIFELFLAKEQGELGNQTELLVRCQHNRRLHGDTQRLLDKVNSWKIQGKFNIHLNESPTRKKRTARVAVRFGKVTLDVPHGHLKRKQLTPLSIYVVHVHEEHPPSGEKPLDWLLLTTWEVTSFEFALTIVRWYGCRWMIEELFRIIKSGYKAEEVQFKDGTALMNWTAMCLIHAVRLLVLLSHRDVETPDSALPFFSEVEIACLEFREPELLSEYTQIHRPPKRSIAWAVLLIGLLGGHKASPSSKPPGQICLWRGLSKLELMAIGWESAMKAMEKRNNV
jgi:hypothetical protein